MRKNLRRNNLARNAGAAPFEAENLNVAVVVEVYLYGVKPFGKENRRVARPRRVGVGVRDEECAVQRQRRGVVAREVERIRPVGRNLDEASKPARELAPRIGTVVKPGLDRMVDYEGDILGRPHESREIGNFVCLLGHAEELLAKPWRKDRGRPRRIGDARNDRIATCLGKSVACPGRHKAFLFIKAMQREFERPRVHPDEGK